MLLARDGADEADEGVAVGEDADELDRGSASTSDVTGKYSIPARPARTGQPRGGKRTLSAMSHMADYVPVFALTSAVVAPGHRRCSH